MIPPSDTPSPEPKPVHFSFAPEPTQSDKPETAYEREIRIFQTTGPAILCVKASMQSLFGMTDVADVPATILCLFREVFGALPDDHWQRLMHLAEIPCAQANCDCHIRHVALVEVIDSEREKWRMLNADRIKAHEQRMRAQQQAASNG